MKRLLLLRHAKSSHDDPVLADHDRPLAPRGRQAARAMAGYMRDHGIQPALVLCSSAIRARQTLDGVAAGFTGSPELRIERELYDLAPAGLLDRLRRLDDDVESAMLIGHNPSMERLAVDLASGGAAASDMRRKFPTGALAILEFSGSWSGLEPDGAELVAFVKPRDL